MNRKRRGPRMDPSGMPDVMLLSSDLVNNCLVPILEKLLT